MATPAGEQDIPPCDYCNDHIAIIFCRADSVKLCLFCDHHVHAANALSGKHLRSQIYDGCRSGKRKAPAKAVGKSKAKAVKDPNKPKRPPSAFFVFLEEFRKTFKKENPTVKAVSAVGKAGGEKWKSLSAAVSKVIL